MLGLLRRDGWTISDDEWDAAWNAVCTNVWRRQQEAALDFRGEPLNYLLATAKNELRRERRRARLDLVSLDADGAPEPVARRADLDEELDLRDKLRSPRRSRGADYDRASCTFGVCASSADLRTRRVRRGWGSRRSGSRRS